jgi:hypothetical protein
MDFLSDQTFTKGVPNERTFMNCAEIPLISFKIMARPDDAYLTWNRRTVFGPNRPHTQFAGWVMAEMDDAPFESQLVHDTKIDGVLKNLHGCSHIRAKYASTQHTTSRVKICA